MRFFEKLITFMFGNLDPAKDKQAMNLVHSDMLPTFSIFLPIEEETLTNGGLCECAEQHKKHKGCGKRH